MKKHRNLLLRLKSLFPFLFLLEFALSLLIPPISPDFPYFIAIRFTISCGFSFILSFRRKKGIFQKISDFYWFLEAITFINFDFQVNCHFRKFFDLAWFLRFLNISMLLNLGRKKSRFFLLWTSILMINMIILGIFQNLYQIPLLAIEIIIFLLLFLGNGEKCEKCGKPSENEKNIRELIEMLPIGVISLGKSLTSKELLIKFYNERALNFLGLDTKKLTLSSLAEKIRIFKRSRETSNLEDISREWDLVQFLEFYSKNEKTDEFLDFSKKNEKKNTVEMKIQQKSNNFYIFISKTDALSILKSQNELKTRLINSFSHELKTPLNSSIPLLELSLDEEKSLAKNNYIEKTLICMKLLENSLNNILDYSLILSEQFIMNFNCFELNSLTEEIRKILKEKILIKSLTFSLFFNTETKLYSDFTRLKQILLNLLLNSIQFTQKGEISLNISEISNNPLVLKFIIKDSGIGIPPQKLSTITENLKFNKEIPINSTGSCLGLIVSNNIALLLGSQALEIDSEVEKGTVISFLVKDQRNEGNFNEKKSLDFLVLASKNKKNFEKNNNFNSSSESKLQSIILASLIFDKSRKIREFSRPNLDNLKESSLRIDSKNQLKTFGKVKCSTSTNIIRKISKSVHSEKKINLPKFPGECDPDTLMSNSFPDVSQQEIIDQQDSPKEKIESHDFDELITTQKILKNRKFEKKFSFLNNNNSINKTNVPFIKFSFFEQGDSNAKMESFGGIEKKESTPLLGFIVQTENKNSLMKSFSQFKPNIKNSRKNCEKNHLCQCPQILIVDDDAFNLFSMELLIKKLNFSCAKASNGFEAINLLKEFKFCNKNCKGIQLILMDYQMPELDGVETSKKIIMMREKGEVGSLKIVGCTAFCAKNEVFSMMDAGMNDVIFKPVSKEILEEVLRKYVEKKSEEQEV